MKIHILLSLLVFSLTLSLSCISETNTTTLDLDKMLDYCAAKAAITMNSLDENDKYPRNIADGKTVWETRGVRDWTTGFWPGILWYAYEYTGDVEFKKHAERFSAPIEIIANSPATNHDVGFQVYCSIGNGFRLTESAEYKKIMLSAADTLASLYNPNVGSIFSWPYNKKYDHNTIIDNMMNLELLYWASKNGGDKRLFEIAESHATITMNNIVRADNSTFHLGSFDSETGEFLKGYTHQGYSDSSMWARGQAWGIYGFAISARETGREDFLATAVNLAKHFLERLPEDGIPYWDFDDPKIPDSPKDASAAAIAACGLLELYSLVEDMELKKYFKEAAVRLLSILSTDDYLSGNKNQAFLLHSTGHHPNNSEIDIPIIYADYYFFEALLRLKKMNENI